jgi:hypothetical protein
MIGSVVITAITMRTDIVVSSHEVSTSAATEVFKGITSTG